MSLSRGQRLSWRASEERVYKFFLIPRRVSWPLSRGSFSRSNQTSICCLRPARGLEQKIEFVFPASLETYQREHPEPALLRPVGLTARPESARSLSSAFVHQALLLRPMHSNLSGLNLQVGRRDGSRRKWFQNIAQWREGSMLAVTL